MHYQIPSDLRGIPIQVNIPVASFGEDLAILKALAPTNTVHKNKKSTILIGFLIVAGLNGVLV